MSDIRIRKATLDDIGAVVDLSVNGKVSASSQNAEPDIPEHYLAAFEAISADTNNELIVAEMNGRIVGTMQLTFIPGISYRGGVRMHVESVVVSLEHRNHGIGTQLMEYAISKARQRGCCVVQLMTPKWRSKAHHFYQRLGFYLTHEGAKLELHRDFPASRHKRNDSEKG
jgi:GNAT superfamily N-acetyltransferase